MKACGIDTVLTLPCDRMKKLLPLIPKNFREIPPHAGGRRRRDSCRPVHGRRKPAMVIQSTGLGNSLTVLSSLHKTYELPLPILASWRGVYKEGIPAQVHFGKSLPGILDNTGIPYIIAEKPGDLPAVKSAIYQAYKENTPYVILFSPKIWERSSAKETRPVIKPAERSFDLRCSTTVPAATDDTLRNDQGHSAIPARKNSGIQHRRTEQRAVCRPGPADQLLHDRELGRGFGDRQRAGNGSQTGR